MAHAIRSTPQARLIRRACAACLTALLLSHGVTAHAAAAARNCTLANTTPGPWNGLSGSAITITADTPPGTVLAKRGIAVRGEYQGQAVGPDIVRIHGAWTNGNGGQLGLHETMPTNIAGIGLRWSYRAENGEPSLPYDPTMERVLTSKLAESTSGGAFDTLTLQLYQELILTGPTPGGTVGNVPGAGASFYIDATRNGNVTRDCYQQGLFWRAVEHQRARGQHLRTTDRQRHRPDGTVHPGGLPRLGPAIHPSAPAILAATQQMRGASPAQDSIQRRQPARQYQPAAQHQRQSRRGRRRRPRPGAATEPESGRRGKSDIIAFGPENDAGTPSFDMGSPLDGMVSMPLFAHYVRTGNVTAGHANAKAVFIITYP
ncbi:hypothetical protein JOS77_12430 [Chromobacterium haemolyticum]|nr:hypothetical protein JOS77_12430 [Chromobacterium haemolyticum]